jgi:hypothetical protein
MELKNVHHDGDNLVVSNLNNVNFFFFNYENQVKKQTSYAMFSTRCCYCLHKASFI